MSTWNLDLSQYKNTKLSAKPKNTYANLGIRTPEKYKGYSVRSKAALVVLVRHFEECFTFPIPIPCLESQKVSKMSETRRQTRAAGFPPYGATHSP